MFSGINIDIIYIKLGREWIVDFKLPIFNVSVKIFDAQIWNRYFSVDSNWLLIEFKF